LGFILSWVCRMFEYVPKVGDRVRASIDGVVTSVRWPSVSMQPAIGPVFTLQYGFTFEKFAAPLPTGAGAVVLSKGLKYVLAAPPTSNYRWYEPDIGWCSDAYMQSLPFTVLFEGVS
jgi:hypothetical protein